MTKFLHCRDAGFDCDAVVEGATVEDILRQVRPHAEQAHQVTLDAAMEAKLLALIGEDPTVV